MNERIKELAEQTDFELVECWGKRDRDSLEKFAELIVNECIKVGHHAFINDHSVVPTFPEKKIKEHFGIKV